MAATDQLQLKLFISEVETGIQVDSATSCVLNTFSVPDGLSSGDSEEVTTTV